MRDKGVLSDLNIVNWRVEKIFVAEVPADPSNCQSVAMTKILVFRFVIINLKFN